MSEEQNQSYGYTENPFDYYEQDLCKRCKRRRIDRSENPQSIVCRECREEFIQLKIPPVIIISIIVVAILVVLSAGKFVIDLEAFKAMDNFGWGAEAIYEEEKDDEDVGRTQSNESEKDVLKRKDFSKNDKASDDKSETDALGQARCELYSSMAEQGNVLTAMDKMVTYLDEENPEDISMAITLADVAMEYSYPDYASWVIENFLTGETVDDADAERINGYIDELVIYYDTFEFIETVYNEETLDAEDSEEAYLTVMQNCHNRMAEHLGDTAYDQALLQYNVAFFCTDEEEWIQHLEACTAEDENYFDAQAQLANHYRSKGDLKKAREILSPVYQRNKEDYSVLRSYAVLEMLDGREDIGLSYAESAYNIYPEGEYVADTYIIALLVNEKAEEAEAVLTELEEAGYWFDEDFYAFRLGNMTLEEYYMKG